MHERLLGPGSKAHWESVYRSKRDAAVSWHQDNPALSLALIADVANPASRIIDVGGGSSILAGQLLARGFPEVAVLDISEAAIERAKARIGQTARSIRWIAADVTAVHDLGPFDVWHDRAVFHFLTRLEDRSKYVELAANTIRAGGHLIVGTFAPDGPEQCSGLPVRRYDAPALAAEFAPAFSLRSERRETHVTPWGKPQPFTFAVFLRVTAKPSGPRPGDSHAAR